jgi:hypothetical protein
VQLSVLTEISNFYATKKVYHVLMSPGNTGVTSSGKQWKNIFRLQKKYIFWLQKMDGRIDFYAPEA